MALLLTLDTPDIAGVRNDLWFELQSTGYRTSAATAASFTLAVIQDPSNGDTFTLVLDDVTLAFEFVSSSPDDSGLQVQIGADTDETVDNLVVALRTNYYIDQLFVVTESAGTITLTAREAGLIEAGFTNTSPPALAWNTVSTGSDAVYADNYTANVQVWLEETWGSGTFSALPGWTGTPDENLRLRWNLSGLLLPYLGWDWPAYGTQSMLVLDKLHRRYYLTRWEQYGDPPSPRQISRGYIRTAWHAGSRQIERNDLPDIWSAVRRSDMLNPFLTYRGRDARHEVSSGQDHYIAWFRRQSKFNGQQFDLFCTVHYSDASTQTTTLWTDTNGSGLAQWRVAEFPVGFERMGLDALDPDKVPVKYTVVVRDASDVVRTETHTFWLVDTDANEVHVEYINSLGVLESLRCTGEWSLGLAPEHSEARRVLESINAVLPSEQESKAVQFLTGAPKTRRVFTGWMPRGEFMAVVADLLVSPALRVVDHERDTRSPERIVGSEVVIDKKGQEDEWLYGANLELLAEDAEMAWSDRLNWPALPGDAEVLPEPREPA